MDSLLTTSGWLVARRKHIPVNDRQLPFKLSAQPVSVQRAYSAFLDQYGITDGRRIFLAKADERGTGRTQRQRVLSVYKKGATLA